MPGRPHRSLTRDDVARLRLVALGLAPGAARPGVASPADVVRHHLAMQAQDWRASRWAIGSRIPGSSDGDVLAAYDSGAIVRSWPMRGTVHAVPAEDLHWMLELMGTRALAGVARRWAALGIEERTLERARDVVVELLRGGNQCSRAQLKEALQQAGLDLDGQRAYHTVWYLSQTGTLVQGPTFEGEQQLVLLDEWVRQPRRLEHDEALAELGRRYLGARGPAGVDDLQHWTKLTLRDCRAAFEANLDELAVVERDGRSLYVLREHLERVDEREPLPVLALAAFDEHLLGFRVRDDVLPGEHATRVDPGRNGVFRWTIVVDGQVVGTWKRRPRTHDVRVEVSPFTTIPKSRHAQLRAAVERWAAFAGRRVEVTIVRA